MTTESPTARRTAGRFLTRAMLILAGVIGGVLCEFVCQGVFAGYPRYHTQLLSIIGMILIALIGGAAWIIDERRINADG